MREVCAQCRPIVEDMERQIDVLNRKIEKLEGRKVENSLKLDSKPMP